MAQSPARVTAAEISRIAGVTRATVSNWRRRHSDFPAPVGGAESSPLYDLGAVRAWLQARGQGVAASAAEELRTLLRLSSRGSEVSRLLPVVLVAARNTSEWVSKVCALPEAELAQVVSKAVALVAPDLPVPGGGGFSPGEAAVLRAILRCVVDDDGQTVLEVLAERELSSSGSSGTYGTPEPLADLMARLLWSAVGSYPAQVFDPACGAGALLSAAARHGAARLFGQDQIEVQALRSAVRLAIYSPDADVSVQTGDSLRADGFPGLLVDAVLCNPPYGERDWGHEELTYYDPRWTFGLPARGDSELAWLQHALSHLTPGGQAVLLLPPSVAARGSGRRIRAELLRAGAVRAVIALPTGIAVPLHVGLHLWVLRQPQPGTTADPVLLVDVADEPDPHGPLNWDALSGSILSAWAAYEREPSGFGDLVGTARAIPVIDLLGESVDLTPGRYVHAIDLHPDEAARRATRLFDQLRQSVDELSIAMSERTWTTPGPDRRTWRTATVADLARGNILTVLRSGNPGSGTGVPDRQAHRRVLTGRDVATGSSATGLPSEQQLVAPILIEQGDVLLPKVVHATRATCRVADEQDAGCLLGSGVTVLRVDPVRMDPWFLAKFLLSEENLAASSRMRSEIMIDVRRLQVPLLPLEEQRRYGSAFRVLRRMEQAAQSVTELASEGVQLVSEALTGGALIPSGEQPRHDSPVSDSSSVDIDQS